MRGRLFVCLAAHVYLFLCGVRRTIICNFLIRHRPLAVAAVWFLFRVLLWSIRLFVSGGRRGFFGRTGAGGIAVAAGASVGAAAIIAGRIWRPAGAGGCFFRLFGGAVLEIVPAFVIEFIGSRGLAALSDAVYRPGAVCVYSVAVRRRGGG